MEPLGAEFQARMREGFLGRWIDVYENEGKRSGAYSAPVYGTHPYMLLNYNDTLDAAFTLAHEAGHAMHTVLSYESQPFITSGYTIFVAEVASMTMSASTEPSGRATGTATPVEVSLCAQAMTSTDGSDCGFGALPGSAFTTTGSPTNGFLPTARKNMTAPAPARCRSSAIRCVSIWRPASRC